MANKENKWVMFKNYMHNELGITKEVIRQWIEDAVQKEAKRLVKHEFNNFDVEKIVEKVAYDENYFGSRILKREIGELLTKGLLERIKIE